MKYYGIELCCPHCKGDLAGIGGDQVKLTCSVCGTHYPVNDGIPDLRIFPDPYIDLESDRAKGQLLAEQFERLDFEGLVTYYYSQTPAVPAHHARQYTLGLLAGEARARAALQAWESFGGPEVQGASRSLLDLGCGTGPLLVPAAERFDRLVGVDIAFRWLVVGKKRLAEAGLDIPLICACAEALPFPEGSFDRVASESILEHVRDQAKALSESHRVLKKNGRLYLSTPNHFSLGPDPQTGILAGGYLPKGLVAAIVRRQGGIPPQRHLLDRRSLPRRIEVAGFKVVSVYAPGLSADQRSHFSPPLRAIMDLYELARRLPASRQALEWVGPWLHAVAEKLVIS